MLKRFWRAETGFFLVVWLVLLVGGRSRLFQDPGTFWHTVVGKGILKGNLPYTDSFSYTFGGEPWIAHQWLGEVLMALVDRLGGLDALLLATVTVLASLYTWLAHRLLKAGLHWSLAALLLMLSIGAAASHFHVRPHLASMVGLAVTYALLCDVDAGRIPLKRLFVLVPVCWVWSNLHGGVLGGLLTMAVAGGWWMLSFLLGRDSPFRARRDVGLLAVIGLACGATAFVNPYGWRLPYTWVAIMDSPILPKIIVEHAPLNPTRPDGMLVLLFAAVYGFALLGLRPQWPRITWLLPLLWLYLGCTRIRHAPLFSLTALLAIAEILPHTRYVAWLSAPGRDLYQTPSAIPERFRWASMSLPILVVLAVCGLTLAGAIPNGLAQLDPEVWPTELLAPRQTGVRGLKNDSGRTPVFNECLFGGYLIYYYSEVVEVFVDDRCELYGDEWLLEYVLAETDDTARRLEKLQRGRGRFQDAITKTGSGYDHYFRNNPEFVAVRTTPTATLYSRATP